MKIESIYSIPEGAGTKIKILDPKIKGIMAVIDIPSLLLEKDLGEVAIPDRSSEIISSVFKEFYRITKIHKCSQKVFDWFLKNLRSDGTVVVYSQQMIADDLGLSVTTVRNTIHELFIKGYIRRVRYGLYKVNDGIFSFVKELKSMNGGVASGIFILFKTL